MILAAILDLAAMFDLSAILDYRWTQTSNKMRNFYQSSLDLLNSKLTLSKSEAAMLDLAAILDLAAMFDLSAMLDYRWTQTSYKMRNFKVHLIYLILN